jgi:hypothetical protein
MIGTNIAATGMKSVANKKELDRGSLSLISKS